jgi:hypothetical protein
MTEATITTSPAAVIQPQSPNGDGKSTVLIAMRDLGRPTTWAQRRCTRCTASRSTSTAENTSRLPARLDQASPR